MGRKKETIRQLSVPSTHKLLNEHEVANLIRKSVFWLRRKRHYGDEDGIPYRKIGYHVLYSEADVYSWIEQHETQICSQKDH